jgi:biopolymer transport protein ExbB/TolQ
MTRWKSIAAGGLAALVATHASAEAYAPPDARLVPVAPEDRLTVFGIFIDADPVVKLVMAGLLVAAVAALVLWILQLGRRTPSPRAMAFLSAWSGGAVLVGLFGAAYTLMNSMLGLSNLRPAPTISVVAPGIAEALASVMLGLLGAAIATLAHRHLQGRALRIAEAALPVEVDRAAPTTRLLHQAG